jgi:hypothetical protein
MHEQVELCPFKAHFDDLLVKALYDDKGRVSLMNG